MSQNIYKVTQEIYDILKNGGEVQLGDTIYTWDDSAMYTIVDYEEPTYNIRLSPSAEDGYPHAIEFTKNDKVMTSFTIPYADFAGGAHADDGGHRFQDYYLYKDSSDEDKIYIYDSSTYFTKGEEGNNTTLYNDGGTYFEIASWQYNATMSFRGDENIIDNSWGWDQNAPAYFNDEVNFRGVTKYNDSEIATKNDLSSYVKTSGNQTIYGVKTFDDTTKIQYIQNGIIETHPESSMTLLPYITNDLMGLLNRGGTCTITGITNTINNDMLARLFNGCTDYLNLEVNNVRDEVIITIKLPSTIQMKWGCYFGLGFGNGNWLAHYIKYEVGLAAEGVEAPAEWSTVFEDTNNWRAARHHGFACGTAGINTIRITLSDFMNTTPRIAGIWAIQGVGSGLGGSVLTRNGGDMYGGIVPYQNYKFTLGTPTKKWGQIHASGIYAEAFHENNTKLSDKYAIIENVNNQIDQLQAQIDNIPVREKEIASFSYNQTAPNNALDYALVEEIGGMSYESENLIALEDVEETTLNGITYSVKNGIITLNGTPTTTSSFNLITHSLANLKLLNGDYSIGVYGMITNVYALSCMVMSNSNSLLLNINRDNNQQGGTFNGTPDWLVIGISTQANFTNHKFCLKLVKGTTIPTIDLSTFENGYTGLYNAKVERVAFEQKNLLPIVPRVIYDGTDSAGVYCELDKDGWYTLTKTGAEGKSINFMTSSTNIPAGVYSFRVVFKDLYGQKIGTNIGSFVGLYNVTGDNNSENRAFTISYDPNKYGYILQDANLSYPLKNLYVWLSASLVINEPVTFKVQLVKNSFISDSIKIPNENIAFSWIGINDEDGNYNCIRYNEEDGKYYYHNNVGSYTFTGNETLYDTGTQGGTALRLGYPGLMNIIAKPSGPGIKGIIKFEGLETLTANATFLKNNGVSVDAQSGYVQFFIDTIQTVDEMKAYLTGKTIIYKLATPEVIDISSYMNDEYLQVQENGVVKFVNEKQKAVPNKITYAIKVV